jgi:hypothetical protein
LAVRKAVTTATWHEATPLRTELQAREGKSCHNAMALSFVREPQGHLRGAGLTFSSKPGPLRMALIFRNKSDSQPNLGNEVISALLLKRKKKRSMTVKLK